MFACVLCCSHVCKGKYCSAVWGGMLRDVYSIIRVCTYKSVCVLHNIADGFQVILIKHWSISQLPFSPIQTPPLCMQKEQGAYIMYQVYAPLALYIFFDTQCINQTEETQRSNP